MQHQDSVINSSIRAHIYGLGALLITLVSFQHGAGPQYAFGNLILFMTASSMGGLATFMAVSIAEVPLLFTRSHDMFQVVQSIFFFTAFAQLHKKFPDIQAGLLLIPTWWVSAGIAALVGTATGDDLAIHFFFDVLLLGLARTLLLSPTLSTTLFGQRHRVAMPLFLPEILFLITTTIFGVFFLSEHAVLRAAQVLPYSYDLLFFIGSCCLLSLPILIGMMLTKTLLSEYTLELKNIINTDYARGNFVAARHRTAGLRPEEDVHLFSDKPKNSLGFSSDETILFCTSGCEELLGIPAAQLIGSRVDQTNLPDSIKTALKQLLEASQIRGTAVDEVRLVHDDEAQSQFIEVEMTYTKGTTLSSSGWLATIADITHKRTVETELLRSKKIEMLGVMSQGIAHAVADALTVIQSITGLTKDSETAMAEIRTVASNAGTTIKQLLDYASEAPVERTNLNLASLIAERLEFFKQTVGDSTCITYTQHIPLLPVCIEEQAVLQALSHVLLNAKESYAAETISQSIELDVDQEEISSELAFMQPGARAGTYARIRIKDYGEGISPEIFGKIFDPLYSSKQSHTGLGLSVVFAVMRAHDGFLTVESTPKKGTTISLYFPLASPDTLLATIPPSAPSAVMQPAKVFQKALIIEDDDAVRRILELLLKQLNITTHSYSCAEDALAAGNFDADFFITDLILPGMQGTDVAKILMEEHGMPGLIATGTILERSKLPKRTELLAKPYGIEELSLAIAKLKTI